MADILLHIASYFIAGGVILAAVRLILGPTMADRVVALDSLTVISVSMIVILALISDRVIFLDVAMVYAILSFAGVVAVARYLEGGL